VEAMEGLLRGAMQDGNSSFLVPALGLEAAFGGYFWILRKFLPISLEPEWFCTLALKSRPPDFLQKSFLDSQYVISSLIKWRKKETPYCLIVSGSFRASSFHVGPKSDVTNSKKIRKIRDLRTMSFYVT
jgi:hypothetical protein